VTDVALVEEKRQSSAFKKNKNDGNVTNLKINGIPGDDCPDFAIQPLI
jgi:hypothetical protein